MNKTVIEWNHHGQVGTVNIERYFPLDILKYSQVRQHVVKLVKIQVSQWGTPFS